MKIEQLIEKHLKTISKEWINGVLSKSEISEKIKAIREEKKNHYIVTSTHPHSKSKDFKEFKEKVYTILENAGWKGKRKDLIIEEDDSFGGGVESSIGVESSDTSRSERG